mmetsp:Transcript_5302/g.18790  ORF Transcript_5302/g.18790 Transcript_5302/m.18790 type:complete len:107 (-) Transcript_5302:37-357(-)
MNLFYAFAMIVFLSLVLVAETVMEDNCTLIANLTSEEVAELTRSLGHDRVSRVVQEGAIDGSQLHRFPMLMQEVLELLDYQGQRFASDQKGGVVNQRHALRSEDFD